MRHGGEKSRPFHSKLYGRSPREGHSRHVWKLPPRVSATVTCETANLEEPKPADGLKDKALVEVEIDPPEEVEEGDETYVPALIRVASVTRLSPPGIEPPSQLLEEDIESVGMPSPALKALVDDSTMQFQALGLPSDEPEKTGASKDSSMVTGVAGYDLCTEVSDFLCAPNPEIESCFEFDLGDIVDRCQDEL